MSRWFRMYDELLDDPKVQRLSGDEFKAWINILCLASRNGGRLPGAEDIAFALRLETKKAAKLLATLVSSGLITQDETGMSPHKWNDRQYKSDVSTGRVQRFRKRFKERSTEQEETQTETAPDTDTDTEFPLAKANGAIDPEKVMFDAGVELLASGGVPSPKARSLLGKWKRDHGATRVIEALGRAKREGAIEPIAFIEGCFRATTRASEAFQPC